MRLGLIFTFLNLVLAISAQAQTTTIVSGNWSDATIWSTGVVPVGATNTNVIHQVILDQNIDISTGTYAFSNNVTDISGGTNYTLNLDGVLDVTAGTTTFGGDADINNGSSLTVRSGATLILGATDIKNGATITVEAGGTLIINGNLDNGNNSGTFTIGGLVYVNGNFNNGGDAELIGTGDIITSGSLTNGGSSTTFGSGADCSSGPCSGQNNICGFTNSISASQNRCFVTGGVTPSTLTGSNVASAVYLWEYSTTSSLSGFTSAPGTNNTSSYSPTGLSQTTWYRRRVTSGGCTATTAAIIINILPANSGWTGATNTNWHTGSNWCNLSPPNFASDAVIPAPIIPGANQPQITSVAANCRDLTIYPGASVTITGSATFSVYGNINNSGTFIPSSGTLAFAGSSAQSVTTNGLTINNLVINNSSGVTLNTPAAVSNQITMTAGTVNLSGNTISLGNATSTTALIRGASGGWFYNGTFIRSIPGSTFTQERLFPMGTSSDYRPFLAERGGSGGNTGTLRVTHTGSTTTTDVSVADPSTSSTITRRQESTWSVGNSGLTGGTWTIWAGGTNFGTVGALGDLRLMRSADVVGNDGGATGTISPNEDILVSRTALTSAQLTNTFYIGSIDALQTPLPIQLLSFSGYYTGNGIMVEWSTASEDNFDHFILERSSNGIDFESLVRITGKGGHNIKTKYSHLDESALTGRFYYRLKSIDVDESFDYSKIITVIASGEMIGLSVYPNPVSNQFIHVKLNDGSPSALLVLYDELGKSQLDREVNAGDNEVPLESNIANGIYFVRVFTTTGIQTVKLIVAR